MVKRVGLKEIDENIGGKKPIFQNLPPKLTIRQRLSLLLLGETLIGNSKPLGYSDYIPEYLVKCPKHGLLYATPRGHFKTKECVECLEENLRSLNLTYQFAYRPIRKLQILQRRIKTQAAKDLKPNFERAPK
jgi:hypothetical protein